MLRPFLLVALVTALPARAQEATEIYKCLDPNGRPSYTNDKRETQGKKCELVTRQINIAPTPKPTPVPAPSAGRGDFPRESPTQRQSAKDKQRDILESELAREQTELAKARDALAAQEAVRSGDEKNYARVLERLQPYKDSVETHEKNVEALRRELNNLYK